jgi:glycosyltransferase involved in cell wall biosynthesis
MERAQARIIERLLERGWRVNVLSRVCDLPPHSSLTWTRVPTPRSPFVLAFPLFAVWASVLLARTERRAVTTTLGAIVFSPADVATVQFCHHGFQRLATTSGRGGSRAVSRVNQWLAGRLAREMERWCYRTDRVRHLVAVSPRVAAELRHAFPALSERVTVVPNGVDLHHFRPDHDARRSVRLRLGLSPSAKVGVFVGGDWERKGLDIALGALASRPLWHLLVVGLGDRSHYEALAASIGVAQRVTFTGQQGDTAPFFAAGDVFVLPTLYEGFALVALEAAATGLPLLVTAAAGADGLAVPDVTGWVVERNPAAVSAALARLEDVSVVRRMGSAARAAAAQFSWAAIGDAHASLYEQAREEAEALRASSASWEPARSRP